MKRILFLGANSGLATQMARQLTNEAEAFYLVARNAERLAELAADLKVRGARAVHVLACDLAAPGAEEGVQSWLGDARIDAAFLVHGVLGDQDQLERDLAQARAMIEVNLGSFVTLGLMLAERMARLGGGALVVISSVAGERGKQSNCVYSASMAGRTVFADGLRHRYFKRGVRVVTAKLGPFDSPMTAHMKHGALSGNAEGMAKKVLRGVRRGRLKFTAPGLWGLIMRIIRAVPEKIFLRSKL